MNLLIYVLLICLIVFQLYVMQQVRVIKKDKQALEEQIVKYIEELDIKNQELLDIVDERISRTNGQTSSGTIIPKEKSVDNQLKQISALHQQGVSENAIAEKLAKPVHEVQLLTFLSREERNE